MIVVPQPIPAAPLLDQPVHHTDPSNTAQDNRGTEQNPIIVKELPRDRSNDEQREAKEKAELDRKVTNFTGDLAFYTKLLMAVTALLALGTGWLAWVASRQMKEARGSIAAAKRAADIAERALTELERPYIAVDVPETGIRLTVNGGITFVGPRPRWEAVNYGRTPALLLDRQTLWRHEAVGAMPVPIDPIVDRGPEFPAGCLAAENRPYTETHNFMANLPDAQELLAPDAWRSRRLFFIGYVRYADIFGTIYINGFCLQFDHLSRNFVRIGDDIYNYNRTEKKADNNPL